MKRNRPSIDAATAERLLAGGSVEREHERVARVLAAASAPGRPWELRGRASAMAAFREARPALAQAASTDRSGSVIKQRLVRLFTVKAVALAALAAGAGGIAIAASTGVLPTPAPSERPSVSPAPSTPTPRPSASRGEPAGSPSPSLVGLCRAYQATTHQRGEALASPAFRALVTAAGGEENVDEFCAALAGSSVPSGSASPDSTDPPSKRSPTSPKGDKSDHPSKRPSRSPR